MSHTSCLKFLSLFLAVFVGVIEAEAQYIRPSALTAAIEKNDVWKNALLNRPAYTDEIKLFVENPSEQNGRRKFKVSTLYINTSDIESCSAAVNYLKSSAQFKVRADIDRLCVPMLDKDWATVSIVTPIQSNEIEFKFDARPSSEIGKETLNFGVMGIGAMGILLSLPESVTKWDKSEISTDIFNRWKNHVGSAPVIDKDDWAINYIGHPVSGAAYYVVARHAGLSMWKSFGYSFLMSTFYWEYGFEAFAERPSIQDLIITPVIGSLMGELFYKGVQKIESNDGKLFGSEKLGSVAIFVLNPAGVISKQINRALDSRLLQNTETSFIIRTQRMSSHIPNQPTTLQLGIRLNFNNNKN